MKEGDFFCQKINMKTFLMKLKGLFISKPKQKLSWTCEDYLKGKKWSMTTISTVIKNYKKIIPNPKCLTKNGWTDLYQLDEESDEESDESDDESDEKSDKESDEQSENEEIEDVN